MAHTNMVMVTMVVLLFLLTPVRSSLMDKGLFQRNWWPPMRLLRSDFCTETFESILQRHTYTINKSSSLLDIDYINILHRQRGYGQPASWKMSHLIGRGEDEVMVAIRDDNLYVVGFADQTGQWHAFPDYVHLIPGSIPLPIKQDYESLLGDGGHTNLAKLTLGREAMLDAIHTLSNYQSSVDKKVLGEALVTVEEESNEVGKEDGKGLVIMKN
uniref:rRNA N-glycosylase n=1 Tax=Oryza punctata TaxID=4537 RepID=A0A0E0KHE5_ORYPU